MYLSCQNEQQKLYYIMTQHLKILIIEDEILVARDLSNLLTDWGYDVLPVCASGQEAIDIFQENRTDLVLADVQIKGEIDGVETVRLINKIKRVPTIFITAQTDHQTVLRAKTTLPAAYLLKPFNERNLMISIDIAMNNFHQDNVPKTAMEQCSNSAKDVKLGADVLLRNGNHLFIKQNYRFQKFSIDELVYIEADKNYTVMVFKQQKIAVRLPLQTVFERLSDIGSIVKVHRSFAVNVIFVEEFSENEVVLPKNKLIPMSAMYKDTFLEKFSVL
jgi:two-component system, response regulator PdtaR